MILSILEFAFLILLCTGVYAVAERVEGIVPDNAWVWWAATFVVGRLALLAPFPFVRMAAGAAIVLAAMLTTSLVTQTRTRAVGLHARQ